MRYCITNVFFFTIFLLFFTYSSSFGGSATTEQVSISSEGIMANHISYPYSISLDGRFIVFTSLASNLVNNDSNQKQDVFVRDRENNTTTRVNVNLSGAEGNDNSYDGSISSDGLYVVFSSDATNLVANDTNAKRDIFLHDMNTGQTSRVSVDSNGNQATGHSKDPTISANGEIIAFQSTAANLVANDTNGYEDIFIHIRSSGETIRISVNSMKEQANGSSTSPSISRDGRYVAFSSSANNLVDNDTNGNDDIFVHDRLTGETIRVSINSNREEGNGRSYQQQISGEGNKIVFTSEASNLVSNDTNGLDDIFLHDMEIGTTVRVNLNSKGEQAEGIEGGRSPYVSENGRYVAFESNAVNLIENNTSNNKYIYLKDMNNGEIKGVSLYETNLYQSNWREISLSGFSADGRYLLLIAEGYNGGKGVFVYGPVLPLFDQPELRPRFNPGMIELLLLSQPPPVN